MGSNKLPRGLLQVPVAGECWRSQILPKIRPFNFTAPSQTQMRIPYENIGRKYKNTKKKWDNKASCQKRLLVNGPQGGEKSDKRSWVCLNGLCRKKSRFPGLRHEENLHLDVT